MSFSSQYLSTDTNPGTSTRAIRIKVVKPMIGHYIGTGIDFRYFVSELNTYPNIKEFLQLKSNSRFDKSICL